MKRILLSLVLLAGCQTNPPVTEVRVVSEPPAPIVVEQKSMQECPRYKPVEVRKYSQEEVLSLIIEPFMSILDECESRRLTLSTAIDTFNKEAEKLKSQPKPTGQSNQEH